jgi:hypothetical protein
VSKNPAFGPIFLARFLGLPILIEMLVLKGFSTIITKSKETEQTEVTNLDAPD